jgi:hypothetical protein
LPTTVIDPLHNWMKGFIYVFPHPYFAITDQEGRFEITNAPAGKLRIVAWQEKAGFVFGSRDGIEIDVAADKSLDLGDLKILRGPKDAIKEITDARGQVEVDEKVAGRPVTGVILNETAIQDGFIARLAPLTTMRKFHLAKTKITDVGVRHLLQFRELEHLDLAFTSVTDNGLKMLEGLSNLRTLRVSFSQVTANGVATLQRALPNTKIINE